MATRVITTRCTNCPTVFNQEPVPEEEKEQVEELLEKKRFAMKETFKDGKCPKCIHGTLTVTSYFVPGELKRGDQVAPPAGAEMYKGGLTIGEPNTEQDDAKKLASVEAKQSEDPDVIARRTELGNEILLCTRAMEWLTEKGKTESVLFRAADSYLIYLNQEVQELA